MRKDEVRERIQWLEGEVMELKKRLVAVPELLRLAKKITQEWRNDPEGCVLDETALALEKWAECDCKECERNP